MAFTFVDFFTQAMAQPILFVILILVIGVTAVSGATDAPNAIADGSFYALSYAECRDRARRSVQLCRLGRHDVHLHRRREDDVWDG